MTGENKYELTDAARQEIADAVRIVREDRFERYVRENYRPKETAPEPVREPVREPAQEPVQDPSVKPTPPPVKTPPPAPEEPPRRRGWGLYANDE